MDNSIKKNNFNKKIIVIMFIFLFIIIACCNFSSKNDIGIDKESFWNLLELRKDTTQPKFKTISVKTKVINVVINKEKDKIVLAIPYHLILFNLKNKKVIETIESKDLIKSVDYLDDKSIYFQTNNQHFCYDLKNKKYNYFDKIIYKTSHLLSLSDYKRNELLKDRDFIYDSYKSHNAKVKKIYLYKNIYLLNFSDTTIGLKSKKGNYALLCKNRGNIISISNDVLFLYENNKVHYIDIIQYFDDLLSHSYTISNLLLANINSTYNDKRRIMYDYIDGNNKDKKKVLVKAKEHENIKKYFYHFYNIIIGRIVLLEDFLDYNIKDKDDPNNEYYTEWQKRIKKIRKNHYRCNNNY